MTQLPPDDRRWQEALRKYRPVPPPATPSLEEKLMQAVEKSPQPCIERRLWGWPPALIAGLVMILSSYRLLNPVPESSQSASVESFLQDNWNEVVADPYPNIHNNNVVQVDWRLEASAAH